MKIIAFFDFDGTITTKDTLLEFIKFSKGELHFYVGFLLNSPWLIAYKLKIISNQMAKERVLRFFFGGTSMVEFSGRCLEFKKIRMKDLIRTRAIHEIKLLKNKGAEVVIVSASPENWIRDWAEEMGVQLIATRLMVNNDRLTGKIEGKNCYGKEKVNRIRELYNLADFDQIFAYGDSGGDIPMFGLASTFFYRPFR